VSSVPKFYGGVFCVRFGNNHTHRSNCGLPTFLILINPFVKSVCQNEHGRQMYCGFLPSGWSCGGRSPVGRRLFRGIVHNHLLQNFEDLLVACSPSRYYFLSFRSGRFWCDPVGQVRLGDLQQRVLHGRHQQLGIRHRSCLHAVPSLRQRSRQ
jgi:hypothetical protein